jgi:hypothetical protein
MCVYETNHRLNQQEIKFRSLVGCSEVDWAN